VRIWCFYCKENNTFAQYI